jgi:probable HAF family extracellular repeat protein
MNAGTLFDVTDLGSLNGAHAASYGLSQNGTAVGTATDPFGDIRAVIYGSEVSNLASGGAYGINASGQVAGVDQTGTRPYATIWNNGVATHVAGAGSYAMAINDSGDTAGMLTALNGQAHAFVTRNGVLTDLGPAGGNWSSAYAINNSGAVAGDRQFGSTFRGVVWSATGTTVLPALGGANSYAFGINNAGQVVGSAQTSAGYLNAFLWSAGAMRSLGTLGGYASYAYGINDSAQVVGYSWTSGDTATHAFLYKDGILYDLNSLLGANSDWTLSQALAINNAGQIVGTGFLNGVEHAFLLSPEAARVSPSLASSLVFTPEPLATPEPASWMLALGGFGALAGLGRLRRRSDRALR